MLAAAFTTVALLPGLLTSTVADVKDQTPLPVLLPSTMQMDVKPLYANGGGSEKEYSITIARSKDCGGANACTLAYFTASKGGKAIGDRKATLARGRVGRYSPLSCGGSCSPPILEWKERGVVYRIQGEFGPAKKLRTNLVNMANSAIRKGPR
jgi:hypothetical protein